MEKIAWSEDALRSKAARYCAAAEHCESEVRTKIHQWGGSAFADGIVDYLYEQNYLNTARYCAAYVHDKLLYQGWGRVKIRAMLVAKKLPSADIEAALAGIDPEEYLRVLRHVLQKKKGATPEEVTRFGLQRGFEYELL